MIKNSKIKHNRKKREIIRDFKDVTNLLSWEHIENLLDEDSSINKAKRYLLDLVKAEDYWCQESKKINSISDIERGEH